MKNETKNIKTNLQIVADNVPDIIYSLNPKGEFISLSPSVKSAMGYRPEELIGTSVFQIIHRDDREKVKETFLKSVKSGDTKVKTIRFRMNTKSGKTKHFEIRRKMVLKNGQMIRNDSATPNAYSVTDNAWDRNNGSPIAPPISRPKLRAMM